LAQPTLSTASSAVAATAIREMDRIEKAASKLRPCSNGADVAARARSAAAIGRDAEAVMLASQAIAQGQGYALRRLIHWAPEFRHLEGNPQIQKLMKPRDN